MGDMYSFRHPEKQQNEPRYPDDDDYDWRAPPEPSPQPPLREYASREVPPPRKGRGGKLVVLAILAAIALGATDLNALKTTGAELLQRFLQGNATEQNEPAAPGYAGQ
ncbi:MAG: hypothetical protein QM756_16355 [Polyangiaceae bacterium]